MFFSKTLDFAGFVVAIGGRLSPVTAARVRLMLDPGQIAGLDSEEGGSLNIACGTGATTVTVDYDDRPKLVARQSLAARDTIADHVQSQPQPAPTPADRRTTASGLRP